MRLHRLRARAFGPFADEVEIDFDRLSDAGIFLIHGPTGGGKTSVLDALCFALYANVPGSRPAGRSLRSHHSPPTLVPAVSVEFTAGGRRLRVTRSPEFVRPKTRGTGDRVVPASVLLEELSGTTWTPLTSRADEAGLTIRRVLGLGLEQFSRVVLLPQGEFAAFLRATPDDRRAVLERLFDVSRFGQIESWLATQRRAADHAAEDARTQLLAAVARLEAVVDLVTGTDMRDSDAAEIHLPPTDVPAQELPAAVAALTAAVHEIAVARSAERDAADSRWRDTEEALRRGLTAAAAYDRGMQAKATIARLDAVATQTTGDEQRLAAHDRAWGIAGDLRAIDRAARHQGAAVAAAAAARETAATHAPGLADLDAAATAHLATDIASFDAPVQTWARVADRLHRHHALEREAQESLTTAEARASDALRRSGRASRALDDHAGRRNSAEAAVVQAATLDQQERDLVRLERLRVELGGARERRAAANSLALAATHVAQEAGAVLLDLQQRRLDGMAAELAGGLAPGLPCAVCGSPEHPAPAQPVDVVTPGEIEAAARRFTNLREKASDAAAEVARWESTIAARESDVAEDERPLQALRDALHALRADRRALGDVEARLAVAQGAVAAAHDAATQSTQEHQQALTLVATAQGVLDAAERTGRELRSDLAVAWQRHGTCPCLTWSTAPHGQGTGDDALAHLDLSAVTAVVTHHARAVEILARVTDSDSAAGEASQDLTDLDGQVAARSRHLGFASNDMARAALLAEDVAADLRAALSAAKHQRATATTALEDPDVAEALDGIRPDLAHLSAAAEAAKSTWKAAARVETISSGAARDIAILGEALSTLAAESVRREAAASALAAMSDTVAGLGAENILRMRLSAFVLAGRLEKVVELANERLAVIASGRYRLAHTDALAGAGRRSGLGLEVHDLWTGVTRDPATLSGGEAFMASLALALGLADAVHHEAGGVDLQTLFIDEGFGTLDDESLEQVMSVLDTLREGGRAVGVVSHVADLRGRIPTQLRVDKSPGGSTVTVLSESA